MTVFGLLAQLFAVRVHLIQHLYAIDCTGFDKPDNV